MEKWINGTCAMGPKSIRRTLRSLRRRNVAYPVGQVDDNVRHVLREHNQEADHLANLAPEGQRQITVEKGDSTENWMAVR